MGFRELNVDLSDEHIALRDAARKFLEEVAMIEDGTNEVLALGGADRLMSAKVRGES